MAHEILEETGTFEGNFGNLTQNYQLTFTNLEPFDLHFYDCSAMSYTQILRDKDGGDLDPQRHGLNRDAVRVGLLNYQVGIIAVADGCGLTYWSEIAAHIAVNEFILYCEKHVPKEPPFAIGAMKQIVREGIKSVNQAMLTWKHPKTKAKCNVLDKGGNTTLFVAIVFPYLDEPSLEPSLQASDSKKKANGLSPSSSSSSVPSQLGTPITPSPSSGQLNTPSPQLSSSPLNPTPLKKSVDAKSMITFSAPPPQTSTEPIKPTSPGSKDAEHKDHASKSSQSHHHLKTPGKDSSNGEEVKWGVVFTGMGDSELYCFKVDKPEMPPARDRKNSTLQSNHASTSTIPRDTSSSSEFMKRSSSVSPLTSPRVRQDSAPPRPNPSTESILRATSQRFHKELPSRSVGFAKNNDQHQRKGSLPATPHNVSSSNKKAPTQPSDEHQEPLQGNNEGIPVHKPTSSKTKKGMSKSASTETTAGPPSTSSKRSEFAKSKLSNPLSNDPTGDSTAKTIIPEEDSTEIPALELPDITSPQHHNDPSLHLSRSESSKSLRKNSHEGSTPFGKEHPIAHQQIHSPRSERFKLETAKVETVDDPESVGTPRLPCGTWVKLLTDSGHSPFIPFPGLRDKNIPEPVFCILNPGDAVVACSDGVMSSYTDNDIKWPELQICQYELKGGLNFACQSLMESTMDNHRQDQTDPDDVTLGAIKITSHARKKKSDTLRLTPVEDLTSIFAPEFASDIYKRDYLNDYLSDYK